MPENYCNYTHFLLTLAISETEIAITHYLVIKATYSKIICFWATFHFEIAGKGQNRNLKNSNGKMCGV